MRIFIGLIALVLFSGTVQAQVTAATRADVYDRFFFPSGTPRNYLDAPVSPLPKVRRLLTVLPGVLYRGGGAGGTVQLTNQALIGLCQAGFSLAVYAYSAPFTPVAPVHCVSKVSGQSNTLEYIAGDANVMSYKLTVLRRIKDVIDDPSKGPVLVHCWNGYHASGELAAVALRQFCGWDGEAATEYWLRHAGGYPPISRVRTFSPTPALDISRSEQEVLCRQDQ